MGRCTLAIEELGKFQDRPNIPAEGLLWPREAASGSGAGLMSEQNGSVIDT